MKKCLICLLVMALILSFCAFAHSGRTDSKGGHTDHSTGEYHYHHGYSAHQHTNGVCPYDFKNKTGANSGYSNSSEDKGMTLEKWHAIINPTATPAPIKKIFHGLASAWKWLPLLFLLLPLAFLIYAIVMGTYSSICEMAKSIKYRRIKRRRR